MQSVEDCCPFVNMSLFTTYMESPLGPIEISGDADTISVVSFAQAKHRPAPGQESSPGPVPEAVAHCIEQLRDYFEGHLQHFNVKLQAAGSGFQHKVWQLLCDIPYGQTISYLELARQLGDTKAVRAVGLANGANPIAIIVPCHRVIGSDGKLVGYGGDIWRKSWLLRHELEHAPVPQGRLF